MSLVYLASPYSHPDASVREDRFRAVCKAAGHMMAEGEFVYSPIAHTHPIACETDLPKGWFYWSEFDRLIISKCDELCVLTLDGWDKSEGVAAEIKIAEELGIPVGFKEPA